MSKNNNSTYVAYHYTSLENFYKIINTRTFWLTSLESSNDKTELYYDFKTFIKDLNQIVFDEKIEKFVNLIKESISGNEILAQKEARQKGKFFALCLTEDGDNLTHWDRYAKNATGVSIGLNINAFDDYYRKKAISTIELFHVNHMLYSKNEIKTKIKDTFRFYYELLINMNEKSVIIDDSFIKKYGYRYAIGAYLNIRGMVKNNSFVDENEIRLYHESTSYTETLKLIKSMRSLIEPTICDNLTNNFKNAYTELSLNEINFNYFYNGIREYKTLYLSELWDSNIIPEIILGPLCRQERRELKSFLKANGLGKTRIIKSKVPLQ